MGSLGPGHEKDVPSIYLTANDFSKYKTTQPVPATHIYQTRVTIIEPNSMYLHEKNESMYFNYMQLYVNIGRYI